MTNHNTVSKSIITVKEARKLLGKDSGELTDNQVSEIISTLTLIAREYLYKSGSNNLHGV